jgi:hypothetical protein
MLVGIGGLRHLSGLGCGCSDIDPVTGNCIDHDPCVPPNCLAGETPVTFSDGTYGCQLTLNAQSFGNPAPNCSYGQAYIDQTTNDWACPTPPPQTQQSSGGLGMFIVAALIAFVVWQFVAPKAAKTADKVSKGQFDDFIPGWLKG